MSNRIIEKKLKFIYHVAHLSEDSLASEVLKVQQRLELGLWAEILQFMRDLNIEVRELYELTKQQWKSRVKEAIIEKNKSDLLQAIKSYKKLNYNELKDEEFKTRSYFEELTLSEAQVAFAIDTKMLNTVKSHFPSNKEFEDQVWACQNCTRVDSIRHLIRCPFFEDLRVDKDLKTNNEDIVKYFREIIKIRLEES